MSLFLIGQYMMNKTDRVLNTIRNNIEALIKLVKTICSHETFTPNPVYKTTTYIQLIGATHACITTLAICVTLSQTKSETLIKRDIASLYNFNSDLLFHCILMQLYENINNLVTHNRRLHIPTQLLERDGIWDCTSNYPSHDTILEAAGYHNNTT